MTWAKDLTQPPTEIAESRSSNSSSRMAYRRAATPSARALWGAHIVQEEAATGGPPQMGMDQKSVLVYFGIWRS